jgi:ferredoxin-like protein FixX
MRSKYLRPGQTHAQAIEEYLLSPRLCETCAKPILPKPHTHISTLLRTRFCSSTCYGYKLSKRERYNLDPNHCLHCGTAILIPDGTKHPAEVYKKTFCNRSCARAYRHGQGRTKELGSQIKAEARVSYIRIHANRVTEGWSRVCPCGYEKHVQICHIMPVRQFPDDATLEEINDPSNLVLLCPNCHWEFDHGLLNLDHRKK